MSDLPTKTYAPEFLQAMIGDHEAEQAGATTEESSAVQAKGDAMSDMRSTKSADTRAVEAYIQQSQRRDRYISAVKALRDKLKRFTDGHDVPPDEMRVGVAELLDALLDMETHGGTR